MSLEIQFEYTAYYGLYGSTICVKQQHEFA